MRADRLVAILLLLQRRGQVTAAEMADELEVSERTARRDLEALGMAGIPVYPIRGRGGGWRLAGDGRTDLSGLTAQEARALFLLAGPHADLPPDARAALRKLVRALPETMRTDAEAASQAMVLDPTGWGGDEAHHKPPPVLATVQEAVIDGHELHLAYQARNGEETERLIHPLGIVAKGRFWYLLASTEAGQRTFRIDRISEATVTGRRAERPEDFDLAEAWRSVRDRVDELRTPLDARATVQREVLPIVSMVLGSRLSVTGDDAPDVVAVTVRGHSLPALTADLAGFGAAIVVSEPAELRASLARLGRELANTYVAEPDD